MDCIAEGIPYNRFLEIIQQERPDFIAFETKTPVVKQHWRIINDIKVQSIYGRRYAPRPIGRPGAPPSAGTVPLIVLFGDHVTALPEESFQNSQVDFVLTGGDYDFLLLNLCNFVNGQRATGNGQQNLEPGIYYRENGQIKNTGKFQLNHDLNNLPFTDRDLTKWQLYAYKNGNYKRRPGTYIMSGRDCWWGKCSFCSWPTLYPKFRSRNPNNVLDEVGQLIGKYGVKEIMDDTGTFPAGAWLGEFCEGMIKRGFNKKVYFDCNMRFGALTEDYFALMKKANFRLLLFGLESANQNTLDRLNKNCKLEKIIEDCKIATLAGLYPHITIMFGYPWETYEDALNTLKLGKWLLKKGYAYTMQATLVIPYPGSPLFEECKQRGELKTFDWDRYDMKEPVMSSAIPDDKIRGLIQGMYKVSFSPEFALRKLFSFRDKDDLRYSVRAARRVFGHVLDFSCKSRQGR